MSIRHLCVAILFASTNLVASAPFGPNIPTYTASDYPAPTGTGVIGHGGMNSTSIPTGTGYVGVPTHGPYHTGSGVPSYHPVPTGSFYKRADGFPGKQEFPYGPKHTASKGFPTYSSGFPHPSGGMWSTGVSGGAAPTGGPGHIGYRAVGAQHEAPYFPVDNGYAHPTGGAHGTGKPSGTGNLPVPAGGLPHPTWTATGYPKAPPTAAPKPFYFF